MKTPVVSMRGVSLTYHSPDTETCAVEQLDLDVNEGEILGIVGPSGCGKTTVLSMIAGILSPTSGSVTVCGKNAPDARTHTGYMLQRDELFEWRTIRDNVLLGLQIRKNVTPETCALADTLLEKYGLSAFKQFYPSQLSGGMRQRAALIRTLVLSPDILLLDEPFSALDFQTRLTAVDTVHRVLHTEHKTAIFVTHDISEAVSLCDRIVVLSARPSKVRAVIPVETLRGLTPLQRREAADFGMYFDKIWKLLQPANGETL